MKPSIGRIVHYVAYGTPGGEFPSGVCRAAVITEVGLNGRVTIREGAGPDLEIVGICVLNPTGQFFNRNIEHDEGAPRCSCGELVPDVIHASAHPDSHDAHDVRLRFKPGTWHWPERVE